MTTMTIPGVWRGHGYSGEEPATLAALYRAAASLIRERGYDACEASGPYEGGAGISLGTALRLAAEDASDGGLYELETRLGGFLYLTGQRRTFSRRYTSVADQVASWELDLGFPPRWKTQDEALAVLDGIAAVLDGLS